MVKTSLFNVVLVSLFKTVLYHFLIH